MTHNGGTNFSKSGSMTEESASRDTLHKAVHSMLNELYRKDRSLRQRRAYRSKALSKGGE